MIEDSFPCSYIMVDRHPCHHDPSHILTHRIQSTIIEFADSLRKAQFPLMSGKWSVSLRALDMMVSVVLQCFLFIIILERRTMLIIPRICPEEFQMLKMIG